MRDSSTETTPDSSCDDRRAILGALLSARRPLICGHVRPDGDCVGSMTGLWHFCRAREVEARLYFRGPLQASLYDALPPGAEPCEDFPTDHEADCTICLDAAEARRIHPDFARLARLPVINIDHHRDNPRYGNLNWVDAAASSVGEMLFELLAPETNGWTPDVAQSLFLALAADTGGFRFGNTTERSFEAGAELLRRGARPPLAAETIWGNRPAESVHIAAALMSGITLELEGRFAWSEIRRSVYDANGGEENEPDNLTNELRTIRGVEAALILRETAEGTLRGSLRATPAVDVNRAAALLGGGGHPAAAGFCVDEPYDQARARALETLRREIERQIAQEAAR